MKYTLADRGTTYSYYYTHNSRGDIVGIYDGAGELRAHYKSYLDESKSFSTDSGTDPNKFEVFSAGEYFIAGGSISVLFNIDYMSKRFEEIWW